MPSVKWLSAASISLVVLMLQNSLLVVLTRYSRINIPPEKRYHTSTLVLNQEILKMVVCLFLLSQEGGKCSTALPNAACMNTPSGGGFLTVLWGVCFCKEARELLVPAFLFVSQNYLIFLSLANLEASAFQVLSQTKLPFTALLSKYMLGRHLSSMQWLSLLLLSIGVLLTQAQGSNPRHTATTATQRPVVGTLACLISALSSSYASVYFEKLAKTTKPSLATRNIQLSRFGILFAALAMLIFDVLPSYGSNAGQGREPFRFWKGYDQWLTIALVCLNALGGLLVSAAMKYADNILKTFATGGAVILSGIASYFIWETPMTLLFIVGATLITLSAVLYNKYDSHAHHTAAGQTSKREEHH
ncbi:UDP-galactose transporter [Trypanosoma equiperdum]|uniref:UDP-galactose transporter, putative n=3 Tax=Trypanozoon TaxID=39700 RepID=D0A047_TRYB9|nr:UDP-galactose transporter, putative [Trypanosoma brucei gambiense DAL972]RHW69280.1 UDP-galactose transporter [Trypanosoma brucei equiperdum]CBH16605.1 UDP-galactose transporter, putative [Trypanosoma brucei gambiense DAL972]SCU69563.1 UDP-galactose transporter [Trypanosoma equiperdum]|eukprot:XP_011778869.1 UDP-galactose transporter, putative [Trypanosoma brucei gambiense DAL972]